MATLCIAVGGGWLTRAGALKTMAMELLAVADFVEAAHDAFGLTVSQDACIQWMTDEEDAESLADFLAAQEPGPLQYAVVYVEKDEGPLFTDCAVDVELID